MRAAWPGHTMHIRCSRPGSRPNCDDVRTTIIYSSSGCALGYTINSELTIRTKHDIVGADAKQIFAQREYRKKYQDKRGQSFLMLHDDISIPTKMLAI